MFASQTTTMGGLVDLKATDRRHGSFSCGKQVTTGWCRLARGLHEGSCSPGLLKETCSWRLLQVVVVRWRLGEWAVRMDRETFNIRLFMVGSLELMDNEQHPKNAAVSNIWVKIGTGTQSLVNLKFMDASLRNGVEDFTKTTTGLNYDLSIKKRNRWALWCTSICC
jgi:hypothetical protein